MTCPAHGVVAAAVVVRVVAELASQTDQMDGLRRIGIDEIAHRRGHRYLTVVVDHDTGRLVWAGAGRDSATVRRFFDALGPQRSALLTHVSADGAEWIHTAVTERASQAILGMDLFHVVAWATKALNEVRRGVRNSCAGVHVSADSLRLRSGPQARLFGSDGIVLTGTPSRAVPTAPTPSTVTVFPTSAQPQG